MKNYITKDNERPRNVYKRLSGVARYMNKKVAVEVLSASHRGIFMYAKTPMKIGSASGLILSISPSNVQVALCIVTNFLEQSAHGFGIGAYVSPLSDESRRNWLAFCDHLFTARTALQSSLDDLKMLRPPRVLSFERALTPSAQQLLRSKGIEVAELFGDTDLMRLTAGSHSQLLVAEATARNVSVLARSLRAFRVSDRPKVVLLSRQDVPSGEWEQGKPLAPAKVVHLPCSREILAERLLDALRSDPRRGHEYLSMSEAESLEDAESTAEGAQKPYGFVASCDVQQHLDALEQVSMEQSAQFALAMREKRQKEGFFSQLRDRLHTLRHSLSSLHVMPRTIGSRVGS